MRCTLSLLRQRHYYCRIFLWENILLFAILSATKFQAILYIVYVQ